MALSAMAQETVLALRRQIARLEGTLPERLAAPMAVVGDDAPVLRRHGAPLPQKPYLATGADDFDTALGGGLPKAALTEILGTQSRDAGAVTGFALSLAGPLLRKAGAAHAPILWVGTAEIFREGGSPYLPGLLELFGIDAADLLIAEAPKLADALWIAEEAAGLKALAAVLLEIRGNPAKLNLTATRRLHRRARAAGRPVFLLRQAATGEPTAAPVRLAVSPAPASPRLLLGGPLPGSIGPPGFEVRIDKSRTAPPRQFTLEWNADDHAFTDRQQPALWPQDHGAVVSLSQHRADLAPAAGTIVAFAPASGEAASGHQSPRKQQPAHRSPRRAG
jgi:protein ImuA